MRPILGPGNVYGCSVDISGIIRLQCRIFGAFKAELAVRMVMDLDRLISIIIAIGFEENAGILGS